MSTGNFVEVVQEVNNISPGFGKYLLLYSTRKDVNITALSATAINAERAAGTIIGLIGGWKSIAGASVAEKNMENISSGEINKIKDEILADTLTFLNTEVNQDVLKRISGRSFYAVFLDDQGWAYGEQSLKPSCIKTMKVNFSAKTSSSFQSDQTNEKTISITVRYLLDEKEAGFLNAGTEVEDIVSKTSLIGKISSITTHTSSSIVFVMDMLNKENGDLLTTFDVDPINIDAFVNGINVTPSATFAANQLTVTLAKTIADFNTATDNVRLRLSTGDYYMNEIKFNIADFLV
jgi:hypothetical protein